MAWVQLRLRFNLLGNKYLFLTVVIAGLTYSLHDHLFQLTIDHNVSSSIHHGWLDPSAVPQNTKKSVLTRGVGLARTVEIDIYRLPVAARQIFLLCSDGLSDMVDDHKILKILRDNKRTVHHLPSLLIEEACARGGRDNVTVLICEVA